jgi:hypothetical protein
VVDALDFTGVFDRIDSACGSNSAVECQLPKLDVAGSIPVSRSIYKEVMLVRNKEMKAALEAFE